MTQTDKGQKDSSSIRRPGRRQQERLERIERRRKRRQQIITSIVAILVIIVAVIGVLEFQQYTAQQQVLATKLNDQHATSTANARAAASAATARVATTTANIQATATTQVVATELSQGMQTVTAGSPTPTTGPATPPILTQTPQKLPDGLKYIDIKVGPGDTAVAGKTVYVQYTGWVQSTGKKFDSSYDHGGQPLSLPVGQGKVIKGFDEGLLGMKVGGSRRIIIPPALGYGSQPPQGSNIPSNATLIFDVSLVLVQ